MCAEADEFLNILKIPVQNIIFKGMKRGILLVAVAGSFFLGSCDNSSSNKSEGKPIVMGDPATIVTETDSTYLRDMVVDLKPSDLLVPQDSVPPAPVDTIKKADTVAKAAEPKPVQNTSGLSVAFKEVTINIPGIKAKAAAKQQDLQKASGATYQLTDGKLNGASLQVSGATVTNVSMRYLSDVSIKNNLGTLQLDNLSSTSGWKTIKGNNTYEISIPSGSQIQTARINQGTVRNAINKAARNKRMNRKTQQQWTNSVKNVRGAQKPIVVSVRAVMFKIDGKDKAGKSFSKQVRIDL